MRSNLGNKRSNHGLLTGKFWIDFSLINIDIFGKNENGILILKMLVLVTPTQYVVHISYGPHTPLSVCWGWYFPAPDTHVLCMGSRTATGIFAALRLVHSLLKYFFKFQLWYWIQFYTTKYSNLILIFRLLVWIFGSTYRKGEILKQKWHVICQQSICLLLHEIHMGVAVVLVQFRTKTPFTVQARAERGLYWGMVADPWYRTANFAPFQN